MLRRILQGLEIHCFIKSTKKTTELDKVTLYSNLRSQNQKMGQLSQTHKETLCGISYFIYTIKIALKINRFGNTEIL